jgi:hypothetical protein
MTVVQCWDDGVTADVRLVEILRRHGAKATFNLNAGLHEAQRKLVRTYEGGEIWRLGWDEMRAVYDGFTIANHSLTHPNLEPLAPGGLQREIVDGRDRLQQFFAQPVYGFAYPFGTYSDAVMAAVREAGHTYARTTGSVERPFPPENPMALHPCCHFLAPDLWARYEKAREGGVFYFWGHAYEMTNESMWSAFETLIACIGADPGARWGEVAALFSDPRSPSEGRQ